MTTSSSLETTLDAALVDPETTNLGQLWQAIEPVLGRLDVQEQLAVGGAVIERLATLHQAKAEALFEQWQAVYDPEDPTLAQDWLRGLVRSLGRFQIEVPQPGSRDHRAVIKARNSVAIDLMGNAVALEP